MVKTISTTNISVGSLFFVTSNMLVIILTFHEVSSKYVKLPKTSEFLIKSQDGSVFKSPIKRELTKSLDFEDFIKINDQYPEKELAYVANETKQIMLSHDKAPKSQIKIHTTYDSSNLGHMVLSSEKNWDSLSEDKSCIKSVMELDLEHLRKDYIIITENFKQNLTVVKCRENKSCESCSNKPLGYESVCTQIRTKIKLIKLSVNKEIKAENQEVLTINTPSGCKCTLRNKDEEIHFSIN